MIRLGNDLPPIIVPPPELDFVKLFFADEVQQFVTGTGFLSQRIESLKKNGEGKECQ